MSLSLDKITEADVESLRLSLAYLTANDHQYTYTVQFRQSGFSLHVKVDGKPGIDAMVRLCNTLLEAPDTLCHLLVKLFHDSKSNPDNPTTEDQP